MDQSVNDDLVRLLHRITDGLEIAVRRIKILEQRIETHEDTILTLLSTPKYNEYFDSETDATFYWRLMKVMNGELTPEQASRTPLPTGGKYTYKKEPDANENHRGLSSWPDL